MNVVKLSVSTALAYTLGRAFSSVIEDLSKKDLKLSCLANQIFAGFTGRDLCETSNFLTNHCCDYYPSNMLDHLLLGSAIVITAYSIVKQFLPKDAEANNNGRGAHDGATEFPQNTSTTKTKENDTPKADQTINLSTTSVEQILGAQANTNALIDYTTAAEESAKKDEFDPVSASAITSYGGASSSNVLALNTFSQRDSIVGSALAKKIVGGTQLYAQEEDFETKANDGSSLTTGRRQVIKTTGGVAFRSMQTTTTRDSTTKSNTTVLVSNEHTGTDADSLLNFFAPRENKSLKKD